MSKPNVLLVSLDTLRADVAFSGKFPTLERLRRESTSFQHVVSSAPLTPVSHASILTGLQPPGHGIRHLFAEQLDPNVFLLQEGLADEGYRTGAIVSSPGLNDWYKMSRGFSHYDDAVPPLADGRDPLKVVDVKIRGTALKRAPLVVEASLKWLEESRREPFFLFAHFFDAHWPYEPPEMFSDVVGNAYEGEVAYMDHYLGRLLDGITELGYDLDEMIVVCLSDHGEDLAGWYPNDHAGEHGHPEEEGHGCLLFDTTQLVPLWIRAPKKVAAGEEIQTQVRLIDVAPTILDLLQIPSPPLHGVSLLPVMHDAHLASPVAYSETYHREEVAQADHRFPHLKPLKSLRIRNEVKVISDMNGMTLEVYDLKHDPLEKEPVILTSDE